jgi:hypothetical protein
VQISKPFRFSFLFRKGTRSATRAAEREFGDAGFSRSLDALQQADGLGEHDLAADAAPGEELHLPVARLACTDRA